MIGVMYLILFLCFYCDSGAQIIYMTFCLSFQILLIQTLGYNKISFMHILGGIIAIVLFFMINSFIGVSIVYMKNLEQTKADALKSNIQCIEGMHEGLFILSKKNETNAGMPKQLLCNKPARKLLGEFLGGGNFSSNNIHEYLKKLPTKIVCQ